MAEQRSEQKVIHPRDRRFGSETAAPFRPRHLADTGRAVQMMVQSLHSNVKPGEMVELTFGHNKARFYVNWVGKSGTSQEGHVGLQSLASGNYVWDVKLCEGEDAMQASLDQLHPALRLCKRH